MKYVSFVLFGESRLYNAGALKNVDLCEKHYSGWEPVFYVSENAPALKSLQKVARVIVTPASPGLVRSDDPNDISWHRCETAARMVDRYFILEDVTCERACFRDTDSYLSPRDFDAVKRWEDSGALGCSIYECEQHWNGGVMPGLSAVVNIFGNVPESIDKFKSLYKGSHEPWIFYDIHLYRNLFVDPIGFNYIRFGYGTDNPLNVPMPEGYGRFCGDVVDEHLRHEIYDES
jgi:hypothetical protein